MKAGCILRLVEKEEKKKIIIFFVKCNFFMKRNT